MPQLLTDFIGVRYLGYTGSQGVIGYTGSQGVIGYTGSVGFVGSRGNTGFTGSQGIQGWTGSQGVIGYTGSKGDIGFTGSQGVIGFTGSIVTGLLPSTNTTVVAADAGKYLNVSSGITINTSTDFASGDTVSVYNNSGSNISITATSVTLRLAGTATTGSRTLAQKGLATILCVGTNDYVISGAGVT
jgi:collagen type VII alpha